MNVLLAKKQIVSTPLLNTYILPTLCCINSTFCRWCWSGLPPTTALAAPPCTRLKRSVGDQSEPSSKICFWQVWGQYIIHWVTGQNHATQAAGTGTHSTHSTQLNSTLSTHKTQRMQLPDVHDEQHYPPSDFTIFSRRDIQRACLRTWQGLSQLRPVQPC